MQSELITTGGQAVGRTYPSPTGPSSYGDTFAAPGSNVHQGDRYEGNTFVQYISDSGASLPNDALLRSFARQNAVLVQNFEGRMHALRTSIDQDTRAKSRALQDIDSDIKDLEDRMSKNKHELQSATEESDAVQAHVQILTAMYRTLNEALETLRTSLHAYANETERLENESLLRDIEKSRRNVTDALSTASDVTQIATSIPVKNTKLNGANRTINDAAGKFGIFNRMVVHARNLYSSDKGNGPRQQGQATASESAGARQFPGSLANERQISSNSRWRPDTQQQTSSSNEEEERPPPPARARQDVYFVQQGSMPSLGGIELNERPSSLRSTTQGSAITRGGWTPPDCSFPPPPSARPSAGPLTASSPSRLASRASAGSPHPNIPLAVHKPLPPPLPARAPPKPPRPTVTDRSVTEPVIHSMNHGITSLSDSYNPVRTTSSTPKRPPVAPKPRRLQSASASASAGQQPVSTVVSQDVLSQPHTFTPRDPQTSSPPGCSLMSAADVGYQLSPASTRSTESDRSAITPRTSSSSVDPPALDIQGDLCLTFAQRRARLAKLQTTQ